MHTQTRKGERQSKIGFSHSRFSSQQVICFLLPVSSAIQINFIGQLLFSDVVVSILMLFLVAGRQLKLSDPVLKKVLFMLCLWLSGAIITDIYLNTPINDYLRGWAKIVLFGEYIVVFFHYVQNRKRNYSIVFLGIGCALLLRWIIGDSEFQNGDFFGYAWRFGNGVGVTILFCLIVDNQRPKFARRLFLPFSFLHLFLNFRSGFLISFAALLSSSNFLRFRLVSNRNFIGFLAILLAILAIPLMEVGYDQLVRSGIFGQELLDKHIQQTNGGVSILLGGRSEILVSSRAIADSPLLGHGSWAKNIEYVKQYFMLREKNGMSVNWEELETRIAVIPSHSHLLGAWVEHGILGGLFWLYCLSLTIRALICLSFGVGRFGMLERFIVFSMLWDILFSPFGYHGRVFMAANLVLAMSLLAEDRRTHFHSFRKRL